MKVAHLLRKYNPAEWGGTETALKRLLDGLRALDVADAVFCPRLDTTVAEDPLAEAGYHVHRFNACVPVWGIPAPQRRQLVAVGGNLMSFTLPLSLSRTPGLSLIHTHTLGRLAGIGLSVARAKKLPFVVTIHGGVLDLPDKVKATLIEPLEGGWEWGKLFGMLVRSRAVLADADAIITCNQQEATLLREKYPRQRVVVQPHSVPSELYREDQREEAREAFASIRGKRLLLVVGRIDPVKNQRWLVEQAPAIFQRHPDALLVLAGSCTDDAYGASLQADISRLGLEGRVLLTGGLPPGDPRLIGLFQEAEAVILPSVSETFGLVILEAWAAGTAVVATRTSGATSLVKDGENGRLFDLEHPESFHQALDSVLQHPKRRAAMAEAGGKLVAENYDTEVLSGKVKRLYEELIEEKAG